MKAVVSADGTNSLLSQSLVVMGSGMSDGSSHSHAQLPVVLAGQAAGKLQTGRAITQNASIANLWLSVARVSGLTNLNSWGYSTGLLEGMG